MRLSIITVTLNNLAGLKRTRESIIGQTWHDFEWIVVDGGSQDGSVDFLRSLEIKPTWWVSERDSGVYNAMNKGVLHANGQYVIFMNAGDIFHSERTLEQIFNCNLSADVSYGDWMRVYPRRSEFCKAPSPLYPFFFFYGNICQQAMVVKTQLLKDSGFNEDYRVIGDWAKWRQMMLEGRSFCYIPVVVCDFQAETGLSETHASFADNEMKMLDGDFPIGLTIQGECLRGYIADLQSIQRMRQWLIVRCVISLEKKFDAWRHQGIVKTWKNFCLKVRQITKRSEA